MKTCEINGQDKPTCNHIKNLEKIMSEMPDEDILQKNADIIKALEIPPG
jgi:hypothetical protein